MLAGVALVALVATYGYLPPSGDARIPERIGREMAADTLRLRSASGRVHVFARDTSEFPQVAMDTAVKAFESELARAGVKVEGVRRFQVDPLRMVQVPPGDFHEALRRGKAGDVIVSFMGPPLLTDEQRASLREIQAKVVAFCPGYLPRYINLAGLAERGLLHGGVVARADASGDRFETQYEHFAGTGMKGGGR